MKRTALLLVAALALLSAPAYAQQKPVSPLAPASSSPLAQILPKLIADAQAASDDAKAHNDVIAQACYDAIAAVASQQLTAANASAGVIGPLVILQKARDIGKLNSTPQGTQLIMGCAALVQDAKLNMVQFFTSIGGAALVKGVLF